jgi:hypothetical protein
MKRLFVSGCVLLFAASLAAQTATHRSYDTAFLGPPIADPVLQHAKETFVLFGCAYCHGLNLVSRGEATDLMHSAQRAPAVVITCRITSTRFFV